VAQRRSAVDAIRALAGGRYLAPSALERLVDAERETPLRGLQRRPRR